MEFMVNDTLFSARRTKYVVLKATTGSDQYVARIGDTSFTWYRKVDGFGLVLPLENEDGTPHPIVVQSLTQESDVPVEAVNALVKYFTG